MKRWLRLGLILLAQVAVFTVLWSGRAWATDTDADGLSDSDEVNVYLTDPNDWDTDDDFLSDGAEVLYFETNPLDVDSDNDDLEDGDEVLFYDTNPLDSDTDNDGLSDGDEVYVHETDPLDPDTDNDGFGDWWEAIFFPSNPLDVWVTPGCARNELEALEIAPLAYSYTSYTASPSLASNGTGFGLCWGAVSQWNFYSDLGFAMITQEGTTVVYGGTVNVTENGVGYFSDSPAIAFGDDYFGIAYRTYYTSYDLYFVAVDDDGATVNSPILIEGDSACAAPSVVWTGSVFGVAYQENFGSPKSTDVCLARVAEDGSTVYSKTRVASEVRVSALPSIAWTGSEYGIAWEDNRQGTSDWEIYFSRVTASGATVSTAVVVSDDDGNNSRQPSLVWANGEFGLVYLDVKDGDTEVYFARITTGDTLIGPVLVSDDDTAPAYKAKLVWVGGSSVYLATWLEHVPYYGGWTDVLLDVYTAVLDSAGSKVGLSKRVTFEADFWNSTGVSQYAVSEDDGSTISLSFISTENYPNVKQFVDYLRLDSDGDRLSDALEDREGLEAEDWDADDDLMPDGWEVIYGDSCELDPLSDDANEDPDDDEILNIDEYQGLTNPCVHD